MTPAVLIITVTTAGTPVRVYGLAGDTLSVAKIRFEPVKANTGRVYVGGLALSGAS